MKRYIASIPDDMRYFGGSPPAENRSGAPWAARFDQITEPREVLPGFFLFTTRSAVPGTVEMNEISLVVKTPKGGVLVVGCSHPGIERLMEAATRSIRSFTRFSADSSGGHIRPKGHGNGHWLP